MKSSLGRKLILRLMLLGFGLALPLLLAEVVLRFLPVCDVLGVMPLNAANPVLRYVPNQDVTHSSGWNFYSVHRLHINNDGFVNDQEYTAASPAPLFAIIGDSYIEALRVPNELTLRGRLERKVAARGRIYSFAKSGTPFSEYLAWADHARSAYHPTAIMISIVGNDFDESLNQYKTVPAGHYYVPDAKGELALRLFDYRPSRLKQFVEHSALIRYLYLDAELPGIIYRLRHPGAKFVGNTAAEQTEQVVAESKRAVDAFFRDLPEKSGLPSDKVLLTLDAMRPEIYDPALLDAARDSYFAKMRRYFLEVARAKGYAVIDLQEVFIADYAAHHQRLEFPTDNHWNEAGNAAVAAAVERSKVYRSVFGD